MTDPDFMLRYIGSPGFEVRVTGDDEHVAFAAHDPKTGEKTTLYVAPGLTISTARRVR